MTTGIRLDFSRHHQIQTDSEVMDGARLRVLQNRTSTYLALYSDRACTVSAANPVVADSAGRFPVRYIASAQLMTWALHEASDASYSSAVWSDDDIEPYLGSVSTLGSLSGVLEVATKSDLKAVEAGVVDAVFMRARATAGDGGHGLFRWSSSDLSASVTADTQEGIYIAPTSASTGASGAWVRVHDGKINAQWFGAKFDGSTDDATAIQAALDYAVTLAKPASVILPPGITVIGDKLTLNPAATAGSQVELVGAGSDATTIKCASGFSETEVIRFGPASGSSSRALGGLRGFTVDGNNEAGAGTVAGIYIWNAYRCSFEDLGVENVTEDGIVSAGHTDGAGGGDPCNQGNFFLEIYTRNCDGTGLYTRGEKASIFDAIHGDANGEYALFMDSETVSGTTETTENIVGSIMARNCGAGGIALSGVAKLDMHAIHAHICAGPAVHIRATRTGTTASCKYSNLVQIVSRNCKGAIVTASGSANIILLGCSIGSVVHVGAYSTTQHDGFTALGWYGCTIGSITMQSNPGTAVRFADQTGSTNNAAIRIGELVLISNGDTSATDSHGLSIEGASADITVSAIYSANSQTNSGESSYELKVASGVSRIKIGECSLYANESGYELSVADATKINFYGSKLVRNVVKELTAAPRLGTATNDSATAGAIGEFIESEVLAASAVSLTSGAAADVTSISLTAGDWDVWGNVWLAPAATTQITSFHSAIHTTSATLPTRPGKGAYSANSRGTSTGQVEGLFAGQMRISIASTTTVYLIARSNFSVDTNAAYGYIAARRVR